jgi:hypothetical protein
MNQIKLQKVSLKPKLLSTFSKKDHSKVSKAPLVRKKKNFIMKHCNIGER